MKLHNLSVIFIIIIIPILIVSTYYIQLQVDTINMQTSYNSKLLDSTKEAIEAFEINTVEWNNKYSATADSKRRDVKASINTFTTSLANNLGISGASSDYILAYVPAIAYTLYDGYYIYSPAEIKKVAVDEDNVAITDESGNIVYVGSDGNETTNSSNAATEYKHILKPFSSYSERYNDITINYTLDNYIRIYGKIINGENEEEFVSKAGYLINAERVVMPTTATIEGIKLDEDLVLPEILSEQVAYKEDEESDYQLKTFKYIYEAEGKTKVYIDDDTLFQIDNNGTKTNINTLTTTLYKKCVIPKKSGKKWTYLELYQDLNTSKWYKQNSNGVKEEIDDISIYGIEDYQDIKWDFSAIDYVVESYAFSNWVSYLNELRSFKDADIKIFSCNNQNDPENETSIFNKHKRKVIQDTLNSDLSQAITSYARNSTGYTYQMPLLSETDWDQVLNNVSIITFFQGAPIGTKYYNNYAIATSTNNKEYVDPDEIYFSIDENKENYGEDKYYHKEYCAETTGNFYIGYRSIDYIRKSYSVGDETRYYFSHDKSSNLQLECYKCLVDAAQYQKSDDSKITKLDYNTTLARERYIGRKITLPEKVELKYITEDGEIKSEGSEEDGIIGKVDPIRVGDYVEYNSNKNSANTSWNGLWFAFYNNDSKGLQIVSTDYTELLELEGVDGVKNGVETLIDKCKEYVNREQGAIAGRILGAYGFGDNSYKVVNKTTELGDRTINQKGYNTGTTDDENSFGPFVGKQLNLTAPVWVGGYSDSSNTQLPNWRAGGVKYCDLQLGNNPLTTDTLYVYDR